MTLLSDLSYSRVRVSMGLAKPKRLRSASSRWIMVSTFHTNFMIAEDPLRKMISSLTPGMHLASSASNAK